MKAIDSTPSLLSPHKSTMPYLSNRYLSPDLKQTRKDSQSKYSLKDLLTPPKQLSTIEKRQAWKWHQFTFLIFINFIIVIQLYDFSCFYLNLDEQ